MESRKEKMRHYLNPLHVYCRLLNVGLNRKAARSISRWYERAIFKHTVLA